MASQTVNASRTSHKSPSKDREGRYIGYIIFVHPNTP